MPVIELMGVFSLVAALLLEQWRPLANQRYLYAQATGYANFLERQFNAGETQQGAVAWMIAVIPPVLIAGLVHAQLFRWSPLLAVVFNVFALYLTMGFRQFSHYFTDIHLALKEDDLTRARELLGVWRGQDCSNLTREEVARLTIEEALAASHHHVFAVMFWFVLLPGPSGAILYRIAYFLYRRWGGRDAPDLVQFGLFAKRAFEVLDWLPARFTAAAFAVVGDFEDAIFCWRTQAAKWGEPGLGAVLAAGAGAIGVRLGEPFASGDTVLERPQLGMGDEADAGAFDSMIGLAWRALVLWLFMLLLLGIARVFG